MSKCAKCGGYVLRVSWTGLGRFEECPRQDHLVRAGLRQAVTDQRVFLTGNVVDHAMRAWLDQDNPQPGDLVPRARGQLAERIEEDRIVWKGNPTQDQSNVLADAEEALARLEPWLIENVLPFPYQPEARGWVVIHVPDQTGQVQQIEMFYAADILVKRGESFEIYDLKTTRRDDYVRGKTLGQLTFYSLAIAAKFGIPLTDISKTAFITPLTKQLEVPVYPTPDDFRVMIQRVTRYAQAVWAGHIPTKETRDSTCMYRCDVKNHCPIGQTPTPDENGRVDFMDVARIRGLQKRTD